MDNKFSDEVMAAIEHLLRMAAKDKIIIAGFALNSDPMAVLNFGTDEKLSRDPSFYDLACSSVEARVQKGTNVTRIRVQKDVM